jgi:cellulose synthase operon protein YhjQ
LYASSPAQPYQPAARPAPAPADTLQQSRERVASRWFALKGAFDPGQEPGAEPAVANEREILTPVLAVFSLAGGVGKTSLVATLGRGLSSLGEKVLLADTTSHGLLPFYFGASELKSGVVRTFSPPSGSTDAPIHLVSYDVDRSAGDAARQDALVDEIAQGAGGVHRVLLDLNASSGWMIRRLGRMNPTVLVPVAADMNSVISLQTVERYFEGVVDNEGRPIQPYYVLNQFDASLPLHLDVREVLRQQLGERLLPFAVHRSPAMSEALAEGMTVIDYAPNSPAAEDIMSLVTWIRTTSVAASAVHRSVRWSER